MGVLDGGGDKRTQNQNVEDDLTRSRSRQKVGHPDQNLGLLVGRNPKTLEPSSGNVGSGPERSRDGPLR